MNLDSIDYESTALPLSYKRMLVQVAGIEPARLFTAADFKSAVATDYTTRALVFQLYENTLNLGILMTAAQLTIMLVICCLWQVRLLPFA